MREAQAAGRLPNLKLGRGLRQAELLAIEAEAALLVQNTYAAKSLAAAEAIA